MARLPNRFFRRPAEVVARDLIGQILVRQLPGRTLRARIVETEAYLGEHDLASHSARGRTGRTEVMFAPGGLAYVYLIYGVHEMLNIVTGGEGDGQAVLIRAAEPLDGWRANLSGPGRLSRALSITRALNGIDLVTNDELFLEKQSKSKPRIAIGPRVGVEYAKHWARALLRFADADSDAVSKPNLTVGRRRFDNRRLVKINT